MDVGLKTFRQQWRPKRLIGRLVPYYCLLLEPPWLRWLILLLLLLFIDCLSVKSHFLFSSVNLSWLFPCYDTLHKLGFLIELNPLYVITTLSKAKICPSKSKKGCKDQESIQSSTTPDPGYQWESDKLTVDIFRPPCGLGWQMSMVLLMIISCDLVP